MPPGPVGPAEHRRRRRADAEEAAGEALGVGEQLVEGAGQVVVAGGSSAMAAASTARRTSSLAKEAVVPSARAAAAEDGLGAEEVAAVEAEQRPPPSTSGSGISRGEVDAAGPLGQRDLEVGDPVRRQDERHVGVGVESVEGVEHLEEQGRGAHPEGAVLGDEVAVLEHDDGRLVRAGHLGRVVDEAQRPAAQQHGRRAG